MGYNVGSTIKVRVGTKQYFAYVLSTNGQVVTAVYMDRNKKFAIVDTFTKDNIIEC